MQTRLVHKEQPRGLTSPAARFSSVARKHLLSSFLVLTYAGSWLLWLPLVVAGGDEPSGLGFVLLLLGSLLPSVAAVALVAVVWGGSGVRGLLHRLLIWRVGIGWWLATVVLPCLVLAALGLSILLGGDFPHVTVTVPGAVLLLLVSIFPGSAGGEEIGWRGLALPTMQGARSALSASILLGLAWGVWHLPLYLMGTDSRPFGLFLPWVVLTVATSVLFTWVYNGTGGSLLLAILFHAALNLPLTVFLEPLDSIALPFLLYVALMGLAAALVVTMTGASTLSRSGAKEVSVIGRRPAPIRVPNQGVALMADARP
jgi:membrane protease YdiL (CAAX protease family)